MNVLYHKGIYLPDIDLWLDPLASRERAVISHAHSDHVRRHDHTIATPGTARLMEHRYRHRTRFEELELGARTDYGKHALTLLPAGHVRGSAQALVEYHGQRLLYSGDFKLAPSATSEAAETPEADTLIVEATFGLPKYRFPHANEVMEQIIGFCRWSLSEGSTPLLYAYSLGKGQELLGRLLGAGFDIAVHGTTFGVAQVYEQLGCEFPVYTRLDGFIPDGTVVIAPPPYSRRQRAAALDGMRRARTAYVSGWAIDRSARYRMGVDAAFPLSDHADYDDLLEYVRRVNPSRVYTIYGFAAEFAADLRTRGYDAQPIEGPMQARLM
jgi:Cft2 family RNA processing exonuclease